jgi:Na+-driven multidrug efflux pump
LNARLIPVLSIEGAAWATIGTELVVTFGCTAVLASRSRWEKGVRPLLSTDRQKGSDPFLSPRIG